MPTYEYACQSCSHEFELEQRISEPPATRCPKCRKNKARRLITQGNFILKGGGWYADLYSGPSNSAGAKKTDDGGSGKSEKGSDSGDSTESSAKSEAKPKEKKAKKPKASKTG